LPRRGHLFRNKLLQTLLDVASDTIFVFELIAFRIDVGLTTHYHPAKSQSPAREKN